MYPHDVNKCKVHKVTKLSANVDDSRLIRHIRIRDDRMQCIIEVITQTIGTVGLGHLSCLHTHVAQKIDPTSRRDLYGIVPINIQGYSISIYKPLIGAHPTG